MPYADEEMQCWGHALAIETKGDSYRFSALERVLAYTFVSVLTRLELQLQAEKWRPFWRRQA
jgi:hypothetical protein